jgi:hypothetical protein
MSEGQQQGQVDGGQDTSSAGENTGSTSEATPQASEDFKAKYEALQRDVNKAAGAARKDGQGEGARQREQEIADSLGVSVDEAKDIIEAHREREEANRTQAEKAEKRAEKAEKKLQDLAGASEERDRYKAVVENFAQTQREGLPDAVQALLDNLDPASQLEWLSENRESFVKAEEPPARQVRKAPDVTRANGNDQVRGRDRLARAFGNKYG